MAVEDDVIFLEDLEVDCIIGVNDWERQVRQTVRIDYRIPADVRPAARSDRLEDAVDYKSLTKWIIEFVENSEFHLLETLADRTARGCLEEFDLERISLTVEKPGAVRYSRTVGISITREASDV